MFSSTQEQEKDMKQVDEGIDPYKKQPIERR